MIKQSHKSLKTKFRIQKT